ncbi:MAG: hypothetical protein HY700_18175 [Gemmatimonadetes bacterium]|nr:hypothetical protein [Gemmatimonadota bacterium]
MSAGSSGVADHTARLVRHWSQLGHDVLVAGDLQDPAETVASRCAAARVEAILIQYVPFLYGRRGLSRYPEQLARLARQDGMRVVVFIHEPWVPLTRPQWWVLGPLQRLQLHRLMRQVTAAVTAVPAWQRLVRPGAELVYVGSTLDPSPHSSVPLAREGEGTGVRLPAPVVFSPFASGLNWPWIVAAARAVNATPGLIVIGATQEEAAHHPTVSRYMESGWTWRGRPDAGEVLSLLGRARLVLAPFIDGLTGRRTSACAALSTGARVLSSSGPLFDPSFPEAVPAAASEHEFVQLATRLWADTDSEPARARRLEWYARTLDPRLLDRRLLGILLGETAG